MPMKVLIIRFSSIGDIVLTTPVVRGVKEQLNAEVHFLTKSSFSAVLKNHPGIDRLWIIKKDISEVFDALVQEGFDHVIDLHVNLRTRELKTRMALHQARHLRPRPKWHAFSKLNLEKFLLTRFGIDRLPKVHIVDRYLAAAAPLGVRNDGNGLDYFISPDEAVNLQKEKIPAHYIAFVIGAAHATKRLTEQQMIDFCAALPHPIVLLGGPAEKETGARIAAQHKHVINACGRFSLGGSADLVRQAAIVVTHDTGLMHVAAAFHKPIVSVWGNTVPAFGMYPYLPGREVEEKQRRQEVIGLSCRPCSKIGFDQCPKGHFRCIKEQDPATLAKAASDLLNEIR
ncbi:glycosyltransferase family 9 protein [Neolewinella agarilytica]|uniref:glycosyltransferase family 9 protein n=1 Tax=Neolewinella agarilytica TaxID=478744 RepID=UPI002356B3A1|nr:glycosyltransferase family 9 protein [Neolewinella agarilytica]